MRCVPRAERGFILISALWLLILCGAIVAVLMLRGIESATEASDGEDALRTKLALEGAVETVVADMLFNGPRSRWALLPARGTVAVDSQSIQVAVSSEAGRLDLNEADPLLLEAALRGLGVEAGGRALLIGALRQKRAANERIGSLAELRALLAPTIGTNQRAKCLEDQFTIFSGLVRPSESHLPPTLARALGSTASSSPVPAEPGSALRITATTRGGSTLMAIVRITGMLDEVYSASAWESIGWCS